MPVMVIKQEVNITKIKLKPFTNVGVEITSIVPLSEEEKEQVCKGIRIAFSWVFEGEESPNLSEIQEAIDDFNPSLAKKIINLKYGY